MNEKTSGFAAIIRAEPVMARGLALAVVVAVLNLLSAFGVPLTLQQQAAITGLSVAVMLLGLFLIRATVTPVALVVARKVEDHPEALVVSGPAALALPLGTKVRVIQRREEDPLLVVSKQ